MEQAIQAIKEACAQLREELKPLSVQVEWLTEERLTIQVSCKLFLEGALVPERARCVGNGEWCWDVSCHRGGARIKAILSRSQMAQMVKQCPVYERLAKEELARQWGTVA